MKKELSKTRISSIAERRDVALDILLNYVSIIILGICGLGMNFLIARYYSAEILGSFNQVLAIYFVFSLLASGGVSFSVLRAIAVHQDDRDETERIVKAAILLGIVLGCLSSLGYNHLTGFFERILDSEAIRAGINTSTVAVFFFGLNKILLNGVLNGLQKMRSFAAFQSMRYVLLLFVLSMCTALSIRGERLPIVFSVSEGVLFIFLLVDVTRTVRWIRANEWMHWLNSHFAFGLKSLGSGLLVEFNTKVDIVMLGIFLSDRYVGLYSLAALCAEGFMQLVVVIQNNINPIIAQMIEKGRITELEAYIKHIVPRVVLVTLIVGGVSVFLYARVLGFLADEEEYIASILPFGILVFFVVVTSGYMVLGNIFLMASRPGLQTKYMLITIVFNMLLNSLFIWVWGVTGAAIATGLALILSSVILRLYSKRYIGIKI